MPRDLPQPLRGAVTEMTATDPRQRPSARDSAEMLAASGPPPAAPPPADVEQEEPRDPGSSKAGRWIAVGAFVVALLVVLIGLLLWGNSGSDTPAAPETSESTSASPTSAPSSENDQGPGFSIPSLPSNIPTQLPDLPSNIPTQLPDLPSNLPDPGQIGDDAQGFWDQVRDWWNGLTG